MSISARVERLWALAVTHTVVWPTARTDVQRWVSASTTVAAGAEDGSYVARLVESAATAAGRSVTEFLDVDGRLFVRVVEAGSRARFVDVVCSDRFRDPALPFTVLLGADGGVALSHSHELGDGRVSAALLEALLITYEDPGAAFRRPARPAGDGELLAALTRAWLRRPSAIVAVGCGVLRRVSRPTGTELAIASSASASAGRSRTETVVLDDHTVAALERWRTARVPRPSISMSLLTAISRALRRSGYPSRQVWQVMVSMRGGSEALTPFGGNLASRVLVDMDSDRDPADLGREVTGRVRSGEVLALHMLKMGLLLVVQESLRAWRRARRISPPAPRVSASTGLSFTDRGRHAYGSRTPDLVPRAGADGRPEVFTFVRPVMPGIGVNVNWFGGRAHLALTFGPSPLDDAAIDRVVAALRDDVVALLDEALPVT